MSWRASAVWVALWALFFAACDDSSQSERTCGSGAQEIDGECRSQLACGDGTVEQAGECVAASDILTCGAGTRREEGTCVRLSEPVICGEGTREESGTCVSTIDAVTCGEGTELSDDGERCVPIDALTCGPGTDLVSGECVADPCGDGTVEQGDECVPVELSDSAALEGLCPKFARNYCESLARCNCADDGTPLVQRLAVDEEYCRAYVENRTCLNTSLLLTLAVGTGQLVPNVEAIEAFADVMGADGECQIDLPPFLKPATAGTYLFDMLSPATGESEPCLFTEACADPSQVCRFASPESEERLCLAPAAVDEHCSAHADCQAELFCASDSRTCRPRAALAESCSSGVPCVGGACCRGGVCVGTPAETEACCDGNTCGVQDELYCSTGQCVAYAGEGDSCEAGVLCSRDLLCRDFGEGPRCYARMPFCEL